MKDSFFIAFQHLVPQHLLSRIVGSLASSRNTSLKNFLIKHFIEHFNVDMSEAANENYESYESFNEFFCRPLKEGARPLADSNKCILSPADGAISQLGDIASGRIFQAKGRSYSTEELLGGDKKLADTFNDGSFATVYLSPKDYHRVHMPIGGTLSQMTHVPGDLFSVNTVTAKNVRKLFARNERVVTVFDTELGKVAVILVGAMIVASIETVWAGQIAPAGRVVSNTLYGPDHIPQFNAGDEMGRFKLGSTAIVLFEKDKVKWDEELAEGSELKMGQAIGTF